MTFVAWIRSVSFHVVFKDILGTEARVFLPTKNTTLRLVHIYHGLRSSHVISYQWLHLHSPEDTADENIKQIPTDLYHQLSNLRTEQRDEYL